MGKPFGQLGLGKHHKLEVSLEFVVEEDWVDRLGLGMSQGASWRMFIFV